MMVTKQPTGQDLVCLVCHKQAQDIDHVVNRGMGGSKARDVPENKVPLCRECHQAKTNNVLETYVAVDLELDDTGQLNYFWRRRGSNGPWIAVPVEVSQRYGCLVGRLSDGAEGDDAAASGKSPQGVTPAESGRDLVDRGERATNRTPSIRTTDRRADVLASGGESDSSSAPSLKEESDGVPQDSPSDAKRLQTGIEGGLQPGASAGPSSGASDKRDMVRGRGSRGDPSLTHEQRVAITKEIRDAEWGRQWIAGDTGNAWIAELGEEAEQYLSDFGYVHESLANILRVCAAIPAPYRNGNLRYSHHVVVYELPREDQVLRLKECEDEGWSVAEFRRQVKGFKPRAKQWPMEELLAGLEAWSPTDRPRPKGAVRAYLAWLGER